MTALEVDHRSEVRFMRIGFAPARGLSRRSFIRGAIVVPLAGALWPFSTPEVANAEVANGIAICAIAINMIMEFTKSDGGLGALLGSNWKLLSVIVNQLDSIQVTLSDITQ